jgi:hypothetical protein
VKGKEKVSNKMIYPEWLQRGDRKVFAKALRCRTSAASLLQGAGYVLCTVCSIWRDLMLLVVVWYAYFHFARHLSFIHSLASPFRLLFLPFSRLSANERRGAVTIRGNSAFVHQSEKGKIFVRPVRVASQKGRNISQAELAWVGANSKAWNSPKNTSPKVPQAFGWWR